MSVVVEIKQCGRAEIHWETAEMEVSARDPLGDVDLET